VWQSYPFLARIFLYIVTYLLKARTAEPTALKQHSFLGNGCETEQRPLLGNRFLISKNRQPVLDNDSVNTLPRQRIHMQQRNDIFYVVHAEML
jgi:hypothetical protein